MSIQWLFLFPAATELCSCNTVLCRISLFTLTLNSENVDLVGFVLGVLRSDKTWISSSLVGSLLFLSGCFPACWPTPGPESLDGLLLDVVGIEETLFKPELDNRNAPGVLKLNLKIWRKGTWKIGVKSVYTVWQTLHYYKTSTRTESVRKYLIEEPLHTHTHIIFTCKYYYPILMSMYQKFNTKRMWEYVNKTTSTTLL